MDVEEAGHDNWVTVDSPYDDDTLLAIALSASLPTSSQEQPAQDIEIAPPLTLEDEESHGARKHTQGIYKAGYSDVEEPWWVSEIDSLKRKIKMLQHNNRLLKKAPSSRITVHAYTRTKGKKVTIDDRRAVLHCYAVCQQENEAGKIVSTADPFGRTSNYLGISINTIRKIILQDDYTDERGKNARWAPADVYMDALQRLAIELNTQGKAINTRILRNRLKDMYKDQDRYGPVEPISFDKEDERTVLAELALGNPEKEAEKRRRWRERSMRIPSREAIRLLMVKMGFVYRNVGNTKNFIDTRDIKEKRKTYLQGLRSVENEDALFVYLDESYCNQNHVSNNAWYIPGQTVVRRSKGKRYCILHAGSVYGWIGEPRVWPAKYGGTSDYHQNMCSAIFEDYLQELCQHCHDAGFAKVVFVMDNASYHRRENVPPYNMRMRNDAPAVHMEQEGVEPVVEPVIECAEGEDDDAEWVDEALVATPEPAIRRTLCRLRKHELIERLLHFNLDANHLKGLSRRELYVLAQDKKYQVPLASEAITESFGYKILWLPPYHPDLNPIEQAWGLTKNDVADVNDGSDFKLVGEYILNGFDKCDEHWAGLVRHSNDIANAYIERDKIYIGAPHTPGPGDYIVTDTEDEEWEDVKNNQRREGQTEE